MKNPFSKLLGGLKKLRQPNYFKAVVALVETHGRETYYNGLNYSSSTLAVSYTEKRKRVYRLCTHPDLELNPIRILEGQEIQKEAKTLLSNMISHRLIGEMHNQYWKGQMDLPESKKQDTPEQRQTALMKIATEVAESIRQPLKKHRVQFMVNPCAANKPNIEVL